MGAPTACSTHGVATLSLRSQLLQPVPLLLLDSLRTSGKESRLSGLSPKAGPYPTEYRGTTRPPAELIVQPTKRDGVIRFGSKESTGRDFMPVYRNYLTLVYGNFDNPRVPTNISQVLLVDCASRARHEAPYFKAMRTSAILLMSTRAAVAATMVPFISSLPTHASLSQLQLAGETFHTAFLRAPFLPHKSVFRNCVMSGAVKVGIPRTRRARGERMKVLRPLEVSIMMRASFAR